MRDEIRIFIGYDAREAAAYYVCQQSIIEHCSEPERLSFTPVTGLQRDGTNAFTFARFRVPWMCHFQGHAIFLDGDMLVRDDIAKLWLERRLGYIGAALVKRPDYETKHPTKYLGQANINRPRKNWGSVVLWDCSFFPNRILTPDYIETQDPNFLREFRWLADHQIGELPREWNRLVMEEELQDDDKIRHFTIGIPAFAEYADCDGAEEWYATLGRAFRPMQV